MNLEESFEILLELGTERVLVIDDLDSSLVLICLDS